jgi:serine phosphatase RsbU (regulator of sigma subunit)
MRLRTRLALAFVLMSVVPLTVITLYSYSSSLRAFRRAVEAEETVIAADMGRRMETVTSAVTDRMNRISVQAQVRDWGQRDSTGDARFREEVAATLGDAAGLVSKLQFVPAPPEPPSAPLAGPGPRGFPGAPRGPRQRPSDMAGVPMPPPPPGAGPPQRPSTADGPRGPAMGPRPPRPPTPGSTGQQPSGGVEGQVIVDLAPPDAFDAQTLERLKNIGVLKDLENLKNLPAAAVGELTQQLTNPQNAAAVGAAMQAAARIIEQRSQEMQRRVERQAARRAEHEQWVAQVREGKPLDIPVQRDGRTVGTVNAQFSVDRVLLSVLSGRARDSGDVVFAIDQQQHVHTLRPEDRAKLQQLGVVPQILASKETVQRITSGDWMIVARRDASGFIFGTARQIGSALKEIRLATGRNLGLGMLAIVVALVGIAPLSRRMTRNLSVLHSGVNQIAQGDLSTRVPVRSNDEIGQLSEAVNKMAQDLGAHQKLISERERLRGELELCRQIQNEMLPKQPLRLRFAEIKGVSIPAREVGGDFFNYFLMPEGEVGLLVGDVSGKGVGAALLMANVQATLRARLPLDQDLTHLVDTIDHEVEENTPASVYLTLFVGVLDSAQRRLRYVNAGHNPQFVLRAGGGLERLASNGLPVGMFAGHGYKEGTVAVDEGDMLFFYTDGITEVENEAGEMFGSERLERLLTDHHSEGIDGILKRIEQELAAFRGHAELFDDATMMVLRVADAAAAAETARREAAAASAEVEGRSEA